jgi:hypothetical protein
MINHYLKGGLDFRGFVVVKAIEDGKEKIHVPMRSEDLTVRSYIEIAWANLFKLTEDFIISFLALRLQPDYSFLHVPTEHTSVKSPWKVMTTADYEELTATEGWQSNASAVRCLTEYRPVLTNELVSERRTIVIAIPCKEGLVICADQKLSMLVGDSILHDAVKIQRLGTHAAFGVVGNSIFYDPFNPSKVLYSAENVVKEFFVGKKYISDYWPQFAKILSKSFISYLENLPTTYIVLSGPSPGNIIFHIAFWYLKSDGRLGACTFSLEFIREIGLVQAFKLEESDQTFEIGRAFAWGNIRLFDEIKNGSDGRFEELRNDPELSRLLVEDPAASEVTLEEALSTANKFIRISRSMTAMLEPIKEAPNVEEKTDCAIISPHTGFKWLSENPSSSPTRKPARKTKKRRR